MKKYILIYLNIYNPKNEILFRIHNNYNEYNSKYIKQTIWDSNFKKIKHILLSKEECENYFDKISESSKKYTFKIELGLGRVTFKSINDKIQEIKLLKEII